MKEDPETNLLLAQLVEQHPSLYNHQLKAYFDRNLNYKSWKDIAVKLNCKVSECKERWKHVRAAYTRHLREKKLYRSSAKFKKPKKPYYLAKHMKYLEPFLKPRKYYVSTLPSSTNDEFQNREYTDVTCKNEPEESNATIEFPGTSNQESSNSNFTENSWTETEPPTAKKKKRLSTDSEDINKSAKEFPIRKKQSDMNEEHLDFCFLKSMLSDMNLMNSDQKRRFKVGILNLSGSIVSEKVVPISMKRNNHNSVDHPNFISSSAVYFSASAQMQKKQIEANAQQELPITTNYQEKSQSQNTGSRPGSGSSTLSCDPLLKEEFEDL